MNKKNVDWANVETIYPRTNETQPVPAGAVKQVDRMMIPDRSLRQLLHSFCLEGLDAEQFTKLTDGLTLPIPSLAQILHQLHQNEQKKMQGYPVVLFRFASIWKELFLSFASTSSVVCLIKPVIVPVIEHLIESKIYYEAHHEKLAPFCPPLTYLLL